MRAAHIVAAVAFLFIVGALACLSIRHPDHFAREYERTDISACSGDLSKTDTIALKAEIERCAGASRNVYRQELSAYQKWQLKDRRDLYAWQRANSRILFVVVITITLAGLYMAFVHFLRADKGNAQLKFSKEGIELSSEWIGIVVMTLSLGFFYLYLSNVYPIRELPSDAARETATASVPAEKKQPTSEITPKDKSEQGG